jgi:hypothetical protein
MELHDPNVDFARKMAIVRDAVASGSGRAEAMEWLNRCIPEACAMDVYSPVLLAVDPLDVRSATLVVKAFVRMAEKSALLYEGYGVINALSETYVSWNMGTLLGRMFLVDQLTTKVMFKECAALQIVSYDCFAHVTSPEALVRVLT